MVQTLTESALPYSLVAPDEFLPIRPRFQRICAGDFAWLRWLGRSIIVAELTDKTRVPLHPKGCLSREKDFRI